MRPNGSEFPNMHAHALERLEELNHPLIPKLYYYDDIEYECEFIEGEDLDTYISTTGDYEKGIEVYELIQSLMIDMSRIETSHEWPWVSIKTHWRLAAEDIHSKNILITKEGKPYLVDLDQIGWWHPYTVFKIMMNTNISITDSLRYAYLHWENNRTINQAKKRVKDLSDKLHEKNEEIFEKGVRHGFWNVKTKEEIKEKYEKYKHLEEWNK